MNTPPAAAPIPYKIAVLVYIFNDAGQLLLLHRKRPPNQDLYSPIGGKLEQHIGESPYACALREIEEEVGLRLTLDDIRLLGIVSERAFAGSLAPAPSTIPQPPAAAHWLMFCFEVTHRVNFPPRHIDEGRLEWHAPEQLAALSIPKTDRDIIWPLVQQYSVVMHGNKNSASADATTGNLQNPSGFFSVHIDCTDADNFIVTPEHPRP